MFNHSRNLFFLVLALLVCFLSVFLLSPRSVLPEKSNPAGFSAKRAAQYFPRVASRPHMVGTVEHAAVRDSIVAFCNGFQLETVVDTAFAVRPVYGSLVGARTMNISARLPGSEEGKAVYVTAHYDTQPNTPGAADDGSGVVAMMECIRALKANKTTLRNDVVFLFLDAEEPGLLGASALLADSSHRNDIALVLAYDATAVRGANMMIESGTDNRWLIGQYLKVPHPLGTSLSAAVKKTAPGYMDYTVFAEAGIPGLNHVLLEGKSHYHSLIDRYEWFDLRSLKQTGENMLALVKACGNADLNQIGGASITYFNLFGKYMAVYPASWNGWMLWVTNLLFIACFYLYLRREKANYAGNPWMAWLGGLLRFAGVLVIAGLLSHALIAVIRSGYPEYGIFYDGESYNAWLYYISLGLCCVAIFGFVYAAGKRPVSTEALMMGFQTIVLVLLNLLFRYVPEAIYFLLFPLVFSLLAQLIPWQRTIGGQPGWTETLFQFFGALPACMLLPPLIYFTYAGTYGLSQQAAGTGLLVLLLAGFLLPLWRAADRALPGWLASLALMGVLTSLVMAHISSRYTGRHPLRSSLYYQFDADAGKGWWVSDFGLPDRWNGIYLGKSLVSPEADPATYYPGRPAGPQIKGPALPVELPLPEMTVLKDSSARGRRYLQLSVRSNRDAQALRLYFDNRTVWQDMRVNTIPVKADLSNQLFFYGMGIDSLILEGSVSGGKQVELQLVDYSVGIPQTLETVIRPDDIIPSAGWNSNSTQILRRYRF